MRRGIRGLSRATAATLAAGALVWGAAPAHAAADFGFATASGPVPWVLTAECSVVAGYTTDTSAVRYVIKATAHGEGAAFGTQVGCSVYDESGERAGGCSSALVGPGTACTDMVDVPVGDIPRFCVTASALYATGIAQLPPCPERL